ncbi:adenine nucleotide alpha-hydrolase family protein [Roseomonas marmotae]|uniref:Adenine nucleotide alpha hydrolase n=1 Tax=Roseomonas marmotae TaxID=2768161 RepID=A0ABS3KFS4_9PROT|nr:hypothetical protein [Roseomonas marmotae]MBO1076272.1 adenine nucleotide alpha hydrolase [Roseomonas marmotae]QTI77847.1 adenine nucleotide alpha hydrolase [Roseomonas marmotae]
MTPPPEDRLREALGAYPRLTIAISGGVDSMTLAFLAHRWNPAGISMFHAVSPAVPASATERVRRHAARHGWVLEVGDAGEFQDGRYRANPVDRCYFCKTNLYDRIRGMVAGTIASGANLDDLGDYRPGLKAAAERRIVHPFIEAGIGKADVRALARRHGLEDLAELPAQPCLSSRIETGIAIDAGDLAFVELAEAMLARLLPPGATLRCRVLREGIVVEVDAAHLALPGLRTRAEHACAEAGRVFAGLRPYERGSAFIGKPAVLHA